MRTIPGYIPIICLLISMMPGRLYAQKLSFEGGVTFGVYGVDFKGEEERLWGDDFEKSGILGISAGPFVRCYFTADFYGVIELRYSQKGSTFGFINQNFTQSFETIRLDYTEIPFLVGSKNQVIFSSGNKADLYIESGFVFSKLVSSRLKDHEETRRVNTPSVSGFKNYDFSWVIQLKSPYRIKRNEQIQLGLRMEHSIITIHTRYKLYNFDYGLELNYLFN